MGLAGAKDIELRFGGYVEGLVGVIGHADRAVHCAIIARGWSCLVSARA